jgi:hypothetical protein
MGRRVVIIALVAGAVGVATGAVTGHATPPSGVTVTILAKATLPGPLTIQVPKVVTVTKKVRVRTASGKTVIRLVRVKKTVLTRVVACTATSACDIIDHVLVFAPGGSEGWHSHPGVVMVAVKSGTLTIYDTDCSKTTVTAGNAFVMMGPMHVRLVRNEGVVPVEISGTYVFPGGTPTSGYRIDQPAPTRCADLG